MGALIKRADELEALPVGAVVLSPTGVAWQRDESRHPFHWRSTRGRATDAEGLLCGKKRGLILVCDPTSQANADARQEALCVARDILDAELGLAHDTDGIAQMIIAALADDGLIHYSPVPWDFTPGCALRVHGPGMLTAADLDAVPPRSVVVTEEEDIWQKEKDGHWQWQGGQVFGEPMVPDLDPRKEPKSGSDLAQKGPVVLITTGWEA